jgi:PiT family inorganic phosphate transporter
VLRGDGPRHAAGRLADRADHGLADHAADALSRAFCAETGGAITLFAATELGVPVSTTHTITGCIIGVGAARRVSAVRWKVANNIVIAWIITIPASALIAAIAYAIVGLLE